MNQQDDQAEDQFVETIQEKSRRRRRARREQGNIWFGLGTFGMVGWSVAIPAVLGVLLGAWLDANVPMGFSWRLTLLVGGVIIGCLNAWYWISKEQQNVERERERYEDD